MRLDDPGGRSLELTVLRYQFPELKPGDRDYEDDSNWLVIAGRASDGSQSWRFESACLLTGELAELAGWIAALANGEPHHTELTFLEPNLEFTDIGLSAGGHAIRVALDHEMLPPGAQIGDDVAVDLSVSLDALRTAADAISGDVRRFPARGRGLGNVSWRRS